MNIDITQLDLDGNQGIETFLPGIGTVTLKGDKFYPIYPEKTYYTWPEVEELGLENRAYQARKEGVFYVYDDENTHPGFSLESVFSRAPGVAAQMMGMTWDEFRKSHAI